jgi:nucleoside-diphosphate-sugar epimerase
MTRTVLVTGAHGSLGANVVREAVARGLAVRALVRDPARARPREGLSIVQGDALDAEAVTRAAAGCDALFHLVNVSLEKGWIETTARLLEAAIAAARSTGARLVFPGNVWIFGRGKPGELVDEQRPASPCSAKGRARAAMEERLRSSGARFAVVRLPEFYGPHVQTLTGPPLRNLVRGGTAWWFGPADVAIELVFMPDAARALCDVGLAPDVDGEVFHLPGVEPTTPRAFFEEARRQAGRGRMRALPAALVRAAGVVHPMARALADILHLWEDPVLLDGAKIRKRLPGLRFTPYAQGIEETLAWLRANPDAKMYGP